MRRFLFYRFGFSGAGLGAETASLLPFLGFRCRFGWRDGFSSTVLDFPVPVWVERRLLFYRFGFSGAGLGAETASLLPF
ncbi:hypothetical protein [Bacillus sp. CHD6a]|uniref:hypothetical protein n=1 Tax=Bacillus sp. CHD6a TaxID=1643452 RepID=UPI0012E1B44D|nr:hypothetical protein [Bacillus sp. CHD6a]